MSAIPKFVIHLLSGGLDSVVMLHYLLSENCKVHCLLFDYGQRHRHELDFAKRHCERLDVPFTIVSIPTLQGSELTDGKSGLVVPARNTVMLSFAVNLAVASKADVVTYACNIDDAAEFPDCRTKFVQYFNAMLKAQEIQAEVCCPFIDKMKWQIGDLGRQLGVNLKDTWSCYHGGSVPCGECSACLKRIAALGRK